MIKQELTIELDGGNLEIEWEPTWETIGDMQEQRLTQSRYAANVISWRLVALVDGREFDLNHLMGETLLKYYENMAQNEVDKEFARG